MLTASALDLENCDREPIHIPGAIQPHGYLLGFGADWRLQFISENCTDILPDVPSSYLGLAADKLLDRQALHEVRNRFNNIPASGGVNYCKGLPLFGSSGTFDISIYRMNKLYFFSLERRHNPVDLDYLTDGMLLAYRLDKADSSAQLIKDAVRHVFALTQFDRVMVYQLSDEGHGEVVSEIVKPGVGSFKGHRFPASDIPQQARKLYELSKFRLIPDVESPPVRILCSEEVDPGTVDLSFSHLRSVSPIHIEYLRNMGIAASLSLSIMIGGKLWGLIACHNFKATYLSLEHRLALENYARLYSNALEIRLQSEENERQKAAREIESELISHFSQPKKAVDLESIQQALAAAIPHDGIALAIDGKIQLAGLTPSRAQISHLINFTTTQNGPGIFYTNDLPAVFPPAAKSRRWARGFLAIPLNSEGSDYLAFFRNDITQTISWAGNPAKIVDLRKSKERLTPRKSFETWLETVSDKSIPWSPFELVIANSLKRTFVELALEISNASSLERKKLIERQEILIAELNHRVRNILSLIKGIVGYTAAEKMDSEPILEILGRIKSLARAHDLITRQHWGAGSLKELLQSEVEAYLAGNTHRLVVLGQDFLLAPEALSTAALVIHELATNSVKYGSLCASSGIVEVSLTRTPNDDLSMLWQDKGGPAVTKPTRRGFGSTIIERSIPHELGGSAAIEFNPEGLIATFRIPSRYITASHSLEELPPSSLIDDETAAKAPQPLSGQSVLLLEDNLLISLDAQQILEKLGATAIMPVANVADALAALAQTEMHFAVLDMNLGVDTSVPVANELKRRKVPFVFATGYGSKDVTGGNFANAIIIRKPYDVEDFKIALDKLGIK